MTRTIEEIKEEIKADIDELEEMYESFRSGGFRLPEIIRFTFHAGSKLAEAVEDVRGVPGRQKKEVVLSAVKEVYGKVNPDIPWIPEPFETMLENLLLDKVLGAFIDFHVKKYREKANREETTAGS